MRTIRPTTFQYFTHIACIAVRSAISDFDRPAVATVGTLTAAEAVVLADGVTLAVDAVGVLEVTDCFDVDADVDTDAELATGEVLAAAGVPAAPVVLGLDALVATEDGTVDTTGNGAELTATADVASELGLDGPAVRVVGPASVDVHEESRTAPTDKLTSTPLRRLFTVSTPRVVSVTIPAKPEWSTHHPHTTAGANPT